MRRSAERGGDPGDRQAGRDKQIVGQNMPLLRSQSPRLSILPSFAKGASPLEHGDSVAANLTHSYYE
jgi:hypothetical protein